MVGDLADELGLPVVIKFCPFERRQRQEAMSGANRVPTQITTLTDR